MERIQLQNGFSIPAIGVGTWKINDRQDMLRMVRNAYSFGYRLFDTAAAYMNEMTLGRVLKDLQIPREELYIQDKLWYTCYGYPESQEACKRSLRKLKTDYLDVYMIHWPATPKHFQNWSEVNAETWRGLEKLHKEGYVKAIGVSNFQEEHLVELSKTAEILPQINQLEFHPGMMQNGTVSYCEKKGIQVEASSPLGNGKILSNEILGKIAEEKNVSVARVCLKWALKHKVIVIPKTIKEERLSENLNLYDFDLTESEMRLIDSLPFCGGVEVNLNEVM